MNKKLLFMLLCTYGYIYNMADFFAWDSTGGDNSTDSRKNNRATLQRKESRKPQRFEQERTAKLPKDNIKESTKAAREKFNQSSQKPEHFTFRDTDNYTSEQKIKAFVKEYKLSNASKQQVDELFTKINAMTPQQETIFKQVITEFKPEILNFDKLTPEEQADTIRRLQSRVIELQNPNHVLQSPDNDNGPDLLDDYFNYEMNTGAFAESYGTSSSVDTSSSFAIVDALFKLLDLLGSLGSAIFGVLFDLLSQ